MFPQNVINSIGFGRKYCIHVNIYIYICIHYIIENALEVNRHLKNGCSFWMMINPYGKKLVKLVTPTGLKRWWLPGWTSRVFHHMCQGFSQLSFYRGWSGPTFNGESLYWVYKPLLWVYKPLPIWICIVGDKLHIFGESLYWVYWVDESIPYYLENVIRADRP